MSEPIKILAFGGSLKSASWNHTLILNAGKAAEAAGAKVCYLHLKDLPMPIFSEEIERQAVPENAQKFKQLLIEHDGFLIASPEYNSSVTGALKNAIDWASRATEGEAPLRAFKGKIAVIMSASTGSLGGLRGLVHLRAILGNIGVIVLPEQHALVQAHKQFDDNNQLLDAAIREKVEGLGHRLVEVCSKLA